MKGRGRDEKYELTKTYVTERCTIKVYRPVLDPEERERRFEKFKQSTAEFMRAVWREQIEKGELTDGDETNIHRESNT